MLVPLDLIEQPPPEIPLDFSAPSRIVWFSEGLFDFQVLRRTANPFVRMIGSSVS